MALLIPGLVSITFRKLTPAKIIELAVQSGLQTIEWGGDIHVPSNDLSVAREVRQRTEDAGLTCAAYGSYYRLGQLTTPFEPVLATAKTLGAATIRVWAGTTGSAETTQADRDAILAEARRITHLAEAEGIGISLEYHGGTLADTRPSVQKLSEELPEKALDFLWQPGNGLSAPECMDSLRDVLPRLRHVHVFHWWPGAENRRPLAEGEESWRGYLEILRTRKIPTPCLLEFVRDDSADQFLEDAATLCRWIEEKKN